MSEPIPQSIPTSAKRHLDARPPKKRRALSPSSTQSAALSKLFAHPEREVTIPVSATPSSKPLPPPPEIVANVQGSSAGAGSGEFHVYKASRRREYERLRLMEEEASKEKADSDFLSKQEQLRRKDEEKTNKNRAKREKAKARKAKKGKANGAPNVAGGVQQTKTGNTAAYGLPKSEKLGPNPNLVAEKIDVADCEDPNIIEAGGEVKNADEIGIVIHDED